MKTDNNYILLGPPGSGKSTQAELLKTRLNLVHIDIGSELRRVAKEEGPFGWAINEIVNNRREFVPDELIGAIVRRIIRKVPANVGVLLDGAPRRESQIEEVAESFRSYDRGLRKVIFLTLPEEVAVERISKRVLCEKCAKPYILGKDIRALPASCPVCGGGLVQRADDTPEGVRKRFGIFHKDTEPVVAYYEQYGLLIRVDATKEPTRVAEEIAAKL